ncbi:MAG TPA: LTA synthase family protein, partial [Polyangiales bacterium]|nr:LTA synthase family protein [Polyangiales bacterium]
SDTGTSSAALPSDVMKRFVHAGLMPAIPLYKGYPLTHSVIDPTPFPYPAAPNAAPGRPNLVFTLVEQLNWEFVTSFSKQLSGVMPELSALSQRMTRVTEYQSTANPTIHALVASLCSLHAASHYRDVNRGRAGDALTGTPFVCLPKILKDLGYRTVFIQGGEKTFASKEAFLHAHGFEEVHGRPELEQRFPGTDISRWGLHDDVLVAYVQEQIARLEKLRAQDGRPYFVMMLTLDTHSPGLPPPDCQLPKNLERISSDRDSRTMLRALHCTDLSLGKLGRFILDDPARSRSTLWAVTGDHPTSAMRFVRDLFSRQGKPYSGWSGRLPLMLYDPTHQLPQRVAVLSSHIDLAPTLLHMLGVKEAPSAMMGLSIFGLRREHPMLVGRVGPKYVALYRPGRTESLTMGALRDRCTNKEPVLANDRIALSSCDLLHWVTWQDTLWSQKKLFPAKH